MRLFAYGLISVVLVLYLSGRGRTDQQIGVLLTCTLAGDAVISLWLASRADRFGRRKTLLVGSALMAGAGILFIMTGNFALLLITATIGVISPSGNEVGPFLAVEQAALSSVVTDDTRTTVFAWYNLLGSFAGALGALVGGAMPKLSVSAGFSEMRGFQSALFVYALVGVVLAFVFFLMSRRIEVEKIDGPKPSILGLTHSHGTVMKLASLFSLDAFAGGFIIQSLLVYWIHRRFGADIATLGVVFFWANILSGLSGLVAARLARRFGLINTMVFTHLPSNVLLILIPFMPTFSTAMLLLLLRYSISQMDVPTRQSYTMSVVRPHERSAAAGLTNVARTLGAACAPAIVGLLMARPSLFNAPLIIAGTLKIVYDLLLYRSFINHEPKDGQG